MIPARVLPTMGLLALLAVPSASPAQVFLERPALSLISLERTETDRWRYTYRLAYPDTAGPPLVRVLLDLRTDYEGVPEAEAIAGSALLFDALVDRPVEGRSHAPVRIGTPAGWRAAIYRTGALAWSAPRSIHGRGEGVLRPGELVSGFVLESRSVPALRAARVFPHRLRTPQADRRSDPSYTIYETVVLAPGPLPSAADGAFLTEQISLACNRRLLPDCERGRARSEQIAELYAAGEVARATAALALLVEDLEVNGLAAPEAVFVLRRLLARWRARL